MEVTRQSLLFRARTGEMNAWQDLTNLYRPLILGWLSRRGIPTRDVEDLSQDVMLTVVNHLPKFEHSGQRGAFRTWLRTILGSRMADYWRGAENWTRASGGDGSSAVLHEIADPDNELDRQWDEEHDRYVLQCLLDVMEEEFEPMTLLAFRRLAIDGLSGEEAARELGMTVSAVYMAKSRVLRRLRQDAEGLID